MGRPVYSLFLGSQFLGFIHVIQSVLNHMEPLRMQLRYSRDFSAPLAPSWLLNLHYVMFAVPIHYDWVFFMPPVPDQSRLNIREGCGPTTHKHAQGTAPAQD